MAQGVTPVESHGPSEAALLVVNSRVSHKKNIDIMGTYIMSVGGASFFAEPKSWNSTLEAWNRLLGCKESWANYLDNNGFLLCAMFWGL